MKNNYNRYKYIYQDYIDNKTIEILKKRKYKYIIKARDNFLSNWGPATGQAHYQLILCKTENERQKILDDLIRDNLFCNINTFYVNHENDLKYLKSLKSFTLRNDWSRAFKR